MGDDVDETIKEQVPADRLESKNDKKTDEGSKDEFRKKMSKLKSAMKNDIRNATKSEFLDKVFGYHMNLDHEEMMGNDFIFKIPPALTVTRR